MCYKLLYHKLKIFFESNFLASADIKVFGHTYLIAMLPRTSLYLRCFCLAYRSLHSSTIHGKLQHIYGYVIIITSLRTT